MKKSFVCIFILLVACATKQDREPNVFYINGKRSIMGPELMADLHNRWELPIQVKSSSFMNQDDIQWSLDFIAISEIINSKDCKKLKFISSAPYSETNDPMQNTETYYKAEPDGFDYTWSVGVCGEVHKYRIIQKNKSAKFNVIPISL